MNLREQLQQVQMRSNAFDDRLKQLQRTPVQRNNQPLKGLGGEIIFNKG